MKYRYLGRSGLLVSRICLGTMTFGMRDWGCDQGTATKIVGQFLESGGNFIDTADMYSAGISEEMTSEALREHNRDDVVLASKCWFRTRPSANAKGLSRKHITEALEASLRRLGTDYLDLYQVHGPDPFTPMEETMRALDDAVRSGKVRYVGCSNYYAWQMVKANAIANELRSARFISGQHMYNLLRRDVEREILPACADQGMGLLCWSPLAGGMLTGKYDQQAGPPDGSRVAHRKEVDLPRYWNKESFRVVSEVQQVAQECGHSPAQVSLAWLLHHPNVAATIVGARTVEQLVSSLAAGDWDLTDTQYDRLGQVSPLVHGYPRDWIDLSWNNISGNEEFPPRH